MLADFLMANKLSGRLISFADEVMTVHEACHLLKVSVDQIAKSIVFVDSGGEPLLAIVLGHQKVDLSKLSSVSKSDSLRLATPSEVMEMTGYEAGGVPPISIYEIRTFCDPSVMEKKTVFCGGGNARTMMEIKPSEIQSSVDNFVVAEISDSGKNSKKM